MPLSLIQSNDSRLTTKNKIAASVDLYFGAGQSATIASWADARSKLNQIATALSLPTFADGEAGLSVRNKINAVLTSLNAGGWLPPLPPLPTPLVLENFNGPISNYTITFANSAAIVDNPDGTKALELTTLGTSSSPQVTKLNVANMDPKDLGTIAVLIEVPENAEDQNLNSLQCRIGRSPTFDSNAAGSFGSLSSPSSTQSGKLVHAFNISELTTAFALSPGQIDMRLTSSFRNPSSQSVKYKVHAVVAKAQNRPRVILTCDDIRPGQRSWLLPQMQSRGLKGSLYIPTGLVGETNRHSEADLADFFNAGWGMAVDGTLPDVQMTSLQDTAEVQAQLETMMAWLDARGWGNAKRHFCYPGGANPTQSMAIQGAQVHKASVTGDGSNIVTVDATTNIVQGMRFQGFGVPDGTRVAAVLDGTRVQLNNLIPAQTKPGMFTNDSGPFHWNKLQVAVKAVGMLSGRTTTPTTFHDRFGVGDRAMMLPAKGTTGETFSTFRQLLDEAILRGTSVIYYFHDFTEAGGSINTSFADMTSMLDFIVAQKANGLRCDTLHDWWSEVGSASWPAGS